ncbi:MAG: tetratricopeptide repeat protein [Holophagaceae bacterium]|nr:tetratricopeptide repeat protein [Holophagaceae bacterium]
MIHEPQPPPSNANSLSEGWLDSRWFLILLVVLATGLVYSNSLYGGFLYDDIYDILENTSIQKLLPLKDVFMIDRGGRMNILNRPIVNLSFAISYAMGGWKPFYFHLMNLFIHISSTLALFGIVHRGLSLPKLKRKYGSSIPLLSMLIATVWAIHPLQTESVTYITQRFESLMGCFALISFYCAIRVADSPYPIRWSLLSALSCLLALGSKEVAVSIPILILLFDRAFMAGSFKEAWRIRRPLYLGLLVAWCCFGWVQIEAQGRDQWAGFGLAMPWWKYALSQLGVILHYLRLVVWPHPLCIDYRWLPANTLGQILPGAIVVGGLLAGTVFSLFRKPGVGFFGAAFFMILAPTSSFMPIADLAVEHRMYLPLAPVIAFIFISGYHLIQTIQGQQWISWARLRVLLIGIIAMMIACLGILTYLRNVDYYNQFNIWEDTVRKVPNNPRAHLNYGSALKKEGFFDAAIVEYKKAIELAPRIPMAYTNLGSIYSELGEIDTSLDYLIKAVNLDPENPKYIRNLGVVLVKKKAYEDSLICFEKSVQLSPTYAPGYASMGEVYFIKKDYKKSISNFKQAIKINPGEFKYHWGIAISYLESGEEAAAADAFKKALQLAERPAGWTSLQGWIYWQYQKDSQAIPPLREALRMKPDDVQSMFRLSWVLSTSPDPNIRNGAESLKWAEAALSSNPNRPPQILDALAAALAEVGRYSEAQSIIQEAISKTSGVEPPLVEDLKVRLVLYENNKPYRDLNRKSAMQVSSSHRKLSPEIL